MIWHPRRGQLVKVHYRKSLGHMPCHGIIGTVLFSANGKGPKNVCIEVHDKMTDLKWRECIPRGNLQKVIRCISCEGDSPPCCYNECGYLCEECCPCGNKNIVELKSWRFG